MVALHRPLYKVSFHLGVKRTWLLTGEGGAQTPPVTPSLTVPLIRVKNCIANSQYDHNKILLGSK